MDNIEDTTNITGLATLINKKHTDSKLDLDKLEKSMIGTGGIKVIKETDPTREFKNTIQELSDDTGIDLGDAAGDPDDSKSRSELGEDGNDISGSGSYSGSVSESGSYDDSGSQSYSESQSEDEVDDIGREIDKIGNSRKREKSKRSRSRSHHHEHHNDHSTRHERHRVDWDERPSLPERQSRGGIPSQYSQSPQDRYLDYALRAYSGVQSDVNIDKEKEEEEKTTLLEDIDELMSELEHDEVDLTRIPSVNQDSSIDLVRKVHKILRMKYDRRRCNSLGKEIILAGAKGLEYICNGERKIGPFQPDLRDWSNTVRSKLSRMRYETSTIVSGFMHEYNISPWTRICMELVPSMILYSHMRRESHGKANYSPDQMSAAYAELAEFDQK